MAEKPNAGDLTRFQKRCSRRRQSAQIEFQENKTARTDVGSYGIIEIALIHLAQHNKPRGQVFRITPRHNHVILR